MTDFSKDFNRLMHKGFNVYIEEDYDETIYLEAHSRADDSYIIKARYTADGARVSYNAESLVNNIIKLLNPTKA